MRHPKRSEIFSGEQGRGFFYVKQISFERNILGGILDITLEYDSNPGSSNCVLNMRIYNRDYRCWTAEYVKQTTQRKHKSYARYATCWLVA